MAKKRNGRKSRHILEAEAYLREQQHLRELVEAREAVVADQLSVNARLGRVSRECGLSTELIQSARNTSARWEPTARGNWIQFGFSLLLGISVGLDNGIDRAFLAIVFINVGLWLVRAGYRRQLKDDWAISRGTDAKTLSRALLSLGRLQAEAEQLFIDRKSAKEHDDWLHRTAQVQGLVPSYGLGFIYVVSNPAVPGCVKVGMTARAVSERLAELSATNLPHPFELEAAWPVRQPKEVERWAHSLLAAYRVASNREFFAADAARVVETLSSTLGPPSFGKQRTA